MQVITNEKWLMAVSGGGEDLDFDDPVETSQDVGMQNVADSAPSASSSSGDQRNQSQIAADNALKQAQAACTALQFGCAQQAAQVSYYTQSEAYNVCIATGGVPGPNDCGAKPKLHK